MLNQMIHCCLLLTIWLCLDTGVPRRSLADENQPARERLRNDQEAVSGRYARFERLLSQMADMMGHEDPERAELLRRAISKGRERAISAELNVIATTLGNGEFGAARERQKDVTQSLQLLLKLLQSEDRRSSVEKDAERLENILKNVRNTITETKAARNLAQNATAPSNAAPAQQKALDKTTDILDDIQQHDDAKATANESERDSEGEGDNSDKDGGKDSQNPSADSEGKGKKTADDGQQQSEEKSGDDQPSGQPKGETPEDAKSGDPSDRPSQDKPTDSQGQSPKGSPPSDSSQSGNPSSKPSKPSKGTSSQQQSKSESGESPSQDGQPPEDNTPGREELEAAEKLMQEALEELKEQEREAAVENQDEAITQLQKAAKELEEMLKQLREEEKEMVLAALEARFQRLLALQTQIYETTVDLGATPRREWLNNAISQCRELAQQQTDLTRECSQTTGLLREDGTSVSILVAVEDIEADMGSVASRLQNTKTGQLTQSIETDIIEALNELIKATQKEMEEMKSEERQQQQQQNSQQQKKPPLVELMAEIRVLRSLQLRVNRRTTQVHELLQESDSADTADLAEQLEQLAQRQNRLRESAGELAERMEQQR